MDNAKVDAALYLLTGFLQKLKVENPGLIKDMQSAMEERKIIYLLMSRAMSVVDE